MRGWVEREGPAASSGTHGSSPSGKGGSRHGLPERLGAPLLQEEREVADHPTVVVELKPPERR